MITGLSHIGLSVVDLDRSIRFYQEAFGLELIDQRTFGEQADERYERVLGLPDARGKVATLRSGHLEIELFEFEHPRPRPKDPNCPVSDHGLSHFCIEVRDLDSEYARLKTLGARFHCPPQHFPGEANVTYARDPDGNVFELLENLGALR